MTSARTVRGAVLLELAISIPLLLLISFFGLWFCVVQNLRAQLDYVVTNAPFIAMTRGNSIYYRNGTSGAGMALINQFIIDRGRTIPRPLAFISNPNITETPADFYNKQGGGFGGGTGEWAITGFDPDGLPLPSGMNIWDDPSGSLSAHLLAVAYEGLHMGVGSTLSYPCSPTNYPGCAKCRVLIPPDITAVGNALVEPPDLQLICAASPPEPFYSLFKVGMRMFGGSDVAKPVLIASTYPDGIPGGGVVN